MIRPALRLVGPCALIGIVAAVLAGMPSSAGVLFGEDTLEGDLTTVAASPEVLLDTLELDGGPPGAEEPASAGSREPATSTDVDRMAAAATEALQAGILETIGRAGWPSSEWGVYALSLESGESLVTHNADRPMAPASNQKLLTSAAALERLGPGFRFPTFLVARGPVADGVLEGDLVLFGTGDPTLGLQDPSEPEGAFRHFLELLAREGITRIRGDIVGDGSYFGGVARQPSWNPLDLNDWFAAPVSALSFNENMVRLRVVAGALDGAPPQVLTFPEGAGIPVTNRGRTVSVRPSPSLLLVRDDPDAPIEIRGEIHRNGGDVWRSLTVSDPPAYAASVLRETLHRHGIAVDGIARSVNTADPDGLAHGRLSAPAAARGSGSAGASVGRTLGVHYSPRLPELLDVVNKRSHNLFAELLLFTLGRTADGDGTFDGGTRALADFLTVRVGIGSHELEIVDGSGLSRLNRITPNALVRTLKYMNESPHGEHYFASLPEAGNRRELNRMHRSAAVGNLRAKTGTIDRTSALSGLVRTLSGEPILFSIIANDVPSPWAAKRVEDRIGIALAGFRRPDPTPDLLPVVHTPPPGR